MPSGGGQLLNQPQQYTKFQQPQQQPSSIFDHPYYPEEQLEKSIEMIGGGVHQSRLPHEPEVETPQRLNKKPTTSYSGQTEWQKQQPQLLEQLEQQPWPQQSWQQQSWQQQQPEREFLNDQQEEEEEQWQFQNPISTSSPYSPTPQSIGGGSRFEKELPEEEEYTSGEESSEWTEIYPSRGGGGKKGQKIQKQRPQEKTLFKKIE